MVRIRRAARWLDEKKWLSAVIIPMIIALPPSLVVACDFYPKFKTWLESHLAVQFVAVFWPILLVPCAMIWANLKEPVSISVAQLSLFLRIISHIVGKKVGRFHDFKVKHSSKKTIESHKIFSSITQPDDQMKEIVQGVWSYFEGTKRDSSVEIKVALVKMGQEHISKFECFYPSNKGPRFALKELQRSDSCFSTTKSLRTIVVIEDTKKETSKPKRRFVALKGELADEEKSIICFPITEPDEVGHINFVLSICASKPMHFKESEKDVYTLILEHFSQRILLEVFLKEIKLKAH